MTYAADGCSVQQGLLLEHSQVVLSKELHDNIAAPVVLPNAALHQARHPIAALEALEFLHMSILFEYQITAL